MPYPRHYRLTMSGTLFQSEVWSCTLHQGIGGIPLDADILSAARDGLAGKAAHVQTWFETPGSGINYSAKLTEVKFNVIDSSGHYLSNTEVNTHIYPGAGIETSSPGLRVIAPPQISLVMSLGTNLKRGPGSRGRIFIPSGLLGPLTQTSPRIDPSYCDAAMASFKTLVDGLNNWDGIDTLPTGNVCVVSGLGGGIWNAVTSLRVGDIYDTQRRRRNKFNETYRTTAITS